MAAFGADGRGPCARYRKSSCAGGRPGRRPPGSRRSPRTAAAPSSRTSRTGSPTRLPYADAVARTGERPPQRDMADSQQQVANVRGAFATTGPLLVDDLRFSGWTLAMLAGQPRRKGVRAVCPLALATAFYWAPALPRIVQSARHRRGLHDDRPSHNPGPERRLAAVCHVATRQDDVPCAGLTPARSVAYVGFGLADLSPLCDRARTNARSKLSRTNPLASPLSTAKPCQSGNSLAGAAT